MRQFRLLIATICGLCWAAAAACAHDMAFPGPPPGGMAGGAMPQGNLPDPMMSGMYPGMQPVYPGPGAAYPGAGYPGAAYPGASYPGMQPPYSGGGYPGPQGGEGDDEEDDGGRPDPYGHDEYRHRTWSFGAEAMLLARSEGSTVTLVRAGNQNLAGATLLTNEGLQSNYEITPRFNVIIHDVCFFDLGFSFFIADHWHSDAVATNGGATLSLSAPNVLIDTSNAARFFDDSELWSGELNLRFRVLPRLTLLVGGRVLEFSDNLLAQRNLNGNTFLPLYSIDTTNHLAGVQAGFLGSLFQGRCLSLDGVAKLGAFHNHDRNEIHNLAGIGTLTGVSVEGGDSTTLIELGLYATYRFSPHVKAWLGYNVMWLNGVATAPGQIPGNDAFGLNNTRLGIAGASGVSAADTLRFDGATLGIEVSY